MLGNGIGLMKNGFVPVKDIVISEMESLVEWDEYNNCTASVDTVNFISGIGSLKLIRDDTNEKEFYSTYDYTVNLSRHTNVNYYLNVANKADLDNVKIILFTSAAKTESSSFVSTLSSASITNGWNTITTTLSSYSQSGISTLADVKAFKFEVSIISR